MADHEDAEPAKSAGEAGVTATAERPEPAGPGRLAFRRDRDHKLIAGVCAGLGRQCDMDPVIFRITLAVLSATGGVGLIFYGFAWLFVPYKDDGENEVRRLLTGRVDGQALAAVLFSLVGCGIFLSMLRNGGVFTFAAVLSLLLAGAGYWSRNRDTSETAPLTAQAAADAPPEPKAPPITATLPSWWRDPIVKDGTHVGGTGYLWGPGDTGAPDLGSITTVDLSGHRHQHAHPHRPAHSFHPRRHLPQATRGPRWIGGWLFFLSLGAGALVTRLTWDDHPLGTTLQAGLSATLIVLGLGIAVSSFLGRTGAGSLFLALVTAGLLAATTAVPKNITTHWFDTTWRPATTAQLQSFYELGTGQGTLDLSALGIAENTTARTDVNVGVGKVRVIVPRGATVRLTVDVGLGDIRLPGENQKDVDVEPGRHKELTLAPPAGATPAGTLVLSLDVGLGQAEVTRAAS
ncbi:PspC domain-containing protein [Streptomyces roseirectus]|uniref:PspC domain-containing protein n=1 Tax=Streptomyces roseirectus TaxID=2768066 RepID=A0A7H0ID21_9ACTN|nr:PspC domain-containing protein [Streptomyces roseirectus]QNP70687.1 PspC domain-containing protein [Streptomyces roseirectus]